MFNFLKNLGLSSALLALAFQASATGFVNGAVVADSAALTGTKDVVQLSVKAKQSQTAAIAEITDYLGSTKYFSLASNGILTLTQNLIVPTVIGDLQGNADTVTNGVYTTDTGSVTNTMLAGSIANNKLSNSEITINGNLVALGGSTTVSAATTNPLTISTGLQLNSGTTFDGSVAKTLSINSSVATLTGSQNLTNKILTDPLVSGSVDLTGSTDYPELIIRSVVDQTAAPLTILDGLGSPIFSITAAGGVDGTSWVGGVIDGAHGGTGVANTGKTLTLGGNFITSGAFATTLNSTATTSITLPTTGTLATLAGVESLTNKTVQGSFTGPLTGNADTVTNGVYTAGDQTITGVKTFSGSILTSLIKPALIEGLSGGYITFANEADPTKTVTWQLLGSTGKTTQMRFNNTDNRIINFPDATTNLIGDDTTNTVTNKTISGASNTLSNIGNAALTNSSTTINGTAISLGSSGTVTAAAGTLTGTTLSSGVTASSLTSFGNSPTLVTPNIGAATGTSLDVSGTVNGSALGTSIVSTAAFAPVIGDGTNNFTVSSTQGSSYYAVNYGAKTIYVVNYRIIWTSKGSASGAISLSLPAALANVGGTGQFVNGNIGYFSGITYTNQLVTFGDTGGGNFIYIADTNKAGGAPTFLTNTAFSTSGQIRATVIFTT
jgi:hypothetical protein